MEAIVARATPIAEIHWRVARKMKSRNAERALRMYFMSRSPSG